MIGSRARVFEHRICAHLRLRHYNAAHHLWQGAAVKDLAKRCKSLKLLRGNLNSHKRPFPL